MAKKKKSVAVEACPEYAPSLHLNDEEIKKYTGEEFGKFNIGDTLDLTLKFKVTGLSVNKSMDNKESKNVTLELVAKEPKKKESGFDKAIKTIGRKASL